MKIFLIVLIHIRMNRVIVLELDDVDIKIIELLRKNCRMSLSEIARRVDRAVSTVSYKINRLTNMGIIKRCLGVVDAKTLGYMYHVLIMIRVVPARIKELERFLLEHEEVQIAFVITGDYDVAVYAVFKDEEHYFNFVNELHSKELVTETTTFNIVRKMKIDFTMV